MHLRIHVDERTRKPLGLSFLGKPSNRVPETILILLGQKCWHFSSFWYQCVMEFRQWKHGEYIHAPKIKPLSQLTNICMESNKGVTWNASSIFITWRLPLLCPSPQEVIVTFTVILSWRENWFISQAAHTVLEVLLNVDDHINYSTCLLVVVTPISFFV